MQALSTPAIVLHRTRYSDSYSIYQLYTREAGAVGVLVPERRQRRQPVRELLRPLAEVELILKKQSRGELYKIQEARGLCLHHSLQTHPAKGAQAIFLSEFLYRILRTPSPEPELYHFISHSLQLWEGLEQGVANFHLSFLIQLLAYFGLTPELPEEPCLGRFFDLTELRFVPSPGAYRLSPEEYAAVPALLRMSYERLYGYPLNRLQRARILDLLLDYYRLHLHHFPPLKCLPILRQLATTSPPPAPIPVDED